MRRERHKSATAFRQALEDRLRRERERTGLTVEALRKKVLMERFLARLFAGPATPWLLKGGYAFELRYRSKARTTRDLDLAVESAGGSLEARLVELRSALQLAGELELGDFLLYDVGPARPMTRGALEGGGRFTVSVSLDGRLCGVFPLDAGFGDARLGVPEELVGGDWLAFAGFSPVRVRAIPRAQQLAEKIHAYTFRWSDRENTRTKDLVDLLLMIEREELDREAVRGALQATFAGRAQQVLPRELLPPPENWRARFAAMAQEASLEHRELDEAFERLRVFWSGLELP